MGKFARSDFEGKIVVLSVTFRAKVFAITRIRSAEFMPQLLLGAQIFSVDFEGKMLAII